MPIFYRRKNPNPDPGGSKWQTGYLAGGPCGSDRAGIGYLIFGIIYNNGLNTFQKPLHLWLPEREVPFLEEAHPDHQWETIEGDAVWNSDTQPQFSPSMCPTPAPLSKMLAAAAAAGWEFVGGTLEWKRRIYPSFTEIGEPTCSHCKDELLQHLRGRWWQCPTCNRIGEVTVEQALETRFRDIERRLQRVDASRTGLRVSESTLRELQEEIAAGVVFSAKERTAGARVVDIVHQVQQGHTLTRACNGVVIKIQRHVLDEHGREEFWVETQRGPAKTFDFPADAARCFVNACAEEAAREAAEAEAAALPATTDTSPLSLPPLLRPTDAAVLYLLTSPINEPFRYADKHRVRGAESLERAAIATTMQLPRASVGCSLGRLIDAGLVTDTATGYQATAHGHATRPLIDLSKL